MAGVKLEDKVTIEGVESPLLLNGAGIRKKVFFKVYLGSLYLPELESEAQKIINSDGPVRVQMDMLYSKVEKKKLVDAWNDGFKANLSSDELSALNESIQQFNAMFDTLVEGDRVKIDYAPGKGTNVTINGEVKGTVVGGGFRKALLKIWLGDEPVTDSLKKAMLGL
jgi:hypothetical protein